MKQKFSSKCLVEVYYDIKRYLLEVEREGKENDCRPHAVGEGGRRPEASFPKTVRLSQNVPVMLDIMEAAEEAVCDLGSG